MRPAEFHVSRAAMMKASPELVFGEVNDLHRWEAWSPWAKLDPNAKTTFEGANAGKGASMTWSGNHKVGEGTMTIAESRPHELIRFKLDFRKPMKGTNMAEFTFRPEADGTKVVWSMSGKNNFMAKAISLFIDCDKMVGGNFEKGLADLQKVVEAQPA
jgi:hypothetical protein